MRIYILRASPSAAGPLAVTDEKGIAFSGEFDIPLRLVDSANIDCGHQGLKDRKHETSFAVVVLDYSM